MKLEYIGQGRWIPDVPARDLSTEDLQRVSAQGINVEDLVSSGLYREIKVEPKAIHRQTKAELRPEE